MEDNKKVITVSFVAAGALFGYVTRLLLDLLGTVVPAVARLLGDELFSNAVPVVAGLITFATLQFSLVLHGWADGVVSELRKVVWPTPKDTSLMTVVVVVTIMIATVAIGAVDLILSYLIRVALS